MVFEERRLAVWASGYFTYERDCKMKKIPKIQKPKKQFNSLAFIDKGWIKT